MRIILAVVGMFLGVGIVGLAWNDNLGKAYDVITGSAQNSTAPAPSTTPKKTSPPGIAIPPIFHWPPIFGGPL